MGFMYNFLLTNISYLFYDRHMAIAFACLFLGFNHTYPFYLFFNVIVTGDHISGTERLHMTNS